MFNIKKSLADCSSCPLSECASCLIETNSTDDLSKVEVVFVAENPGPKEIEQEVPLIGPSGQVFRRYFNLYFANYFKYLITNTVLCQTLRADGTTGNPSWYVIENCRINCFEIIKQCNPQLIVVMGGSAMRAFGISKAGITHYRGQIYKWNDYEVFLTVHPSYVMRNGEFCLFDADFKKAQKYLIERCLINAPASNFKRDPGQSWKSFYDKTFEVM